MNSLFVLVVCFWLAVSTLCQASQSPMVGVYKLEPNALLKCDKTSCNCCPSGTATVTQTGAGTTDDNFTLRSVYSTDPSNCFGKNSEVLEAVLPGSQIGNTQVTLLGPSVSSGNRQLITLSSDLKTVTVKDLDSPGCDNTFTRTSSVPASRQSPFVGTFDVQPNAALKCDRSICTCCPSGVSTVTQEGTGIAGSVTLKAVYATNAYNCSGSSSETLSVVLPASQTESTQVTFRGPGQAETGS